MKQQDLTNEVDAVVEDRITQGEPAQMSWIVHAVIQKHLDITGSDSEWYSLCAYEHVRATVRKVLSNRRADEGAPESTQAELFPGYERLQRSYTIDRGGEQMVVRLEQMTAGEIREKALELRAMATGAIAHARELDAYLDARAEVAA